MIKKYINIIIYIWTFLRLDLEKDQSLDVEMSIRWAVACKLL